MVRIITINDIKTILKRKQLKNFFLELIEELKKDFIRWQDFKKTPRHATHYKHGVIELMPISDEFFYSFKYVNGHPFNPWAGKLNVVAVGLLAEVISGYPLLISEMTLLTALRTAATSALAASYLIKPGARAMAMIGTGSQSEFQALAHHFILGIDQIHYYDIDSAAMDKFAKNLAAYPLQLIPAQSVAEAINQVDVITTATAAKAKVTVLSDLLVHSGVFINAIGGDCPGKTELDPSIFERSKIVVEDLEQTRLEGEIQHLQGAQSIYAELWELVDGRKPGRTHPDEIFIFDSVGFALEDYSILKYIYRLSQEYHLGTIMDLVPVLKDPKNLFSLCYTA
ncbi:MAG: ornithine cyclodeaminase [Proteobacteria bacterium]|nr:ornithine cyclodeaminase [Pseudomonadota bacterium]